MDLQSINNRIEEFNHLTQGDYDVYIQRRQQNADRYLQGCLKKLGKDSVNSNYTDNKIYNKEEIEYILKIAKELDENSPILWKAFEILGKIGGNRAENAPKLNEEEQIIVKNQITRFFISCILPPQTDLSFWSKLSDEINRLELIKYILETDHLFKGKYLFWKAFYQLNKITLTQEELKLSLKELYPFFGAEYIDSIAHKLNEILYPPLRNIRREHLMGDMYSASFGQGDLEEFISYLEYVINNEGDFNSLMNIVLKSLKQYVAPSESINNNSTSPNPTDMIDKINQLVSILSEDLNPPKAEENPPYNPLEPENYPILYNLRLVDYIFDHEIFNDLFIDNSLKNRSDLERYRDCYKTIFYISQLMSYEDFQNA